MKGFSIAVLLAWVAGAPVVAQDYDYGAPPPGPPPPETSGQYFDPGQLQQMLAPIALYPDPLIAQILPAAGQPSQIAIAANYVNSGGDPNQIDSQPWDPSVQAVAHYPQVLQMMNQNLAWTAQLGQAFINQPDDVMNAIQQLRAQAMQQGNLQTNPEDVVENDNGMIEILPANPDYLYVPQYDPGLVYYQPGIEINWDWWHFGMGPWMRHDFDWRDHRLVTWDRDHERPRGWYHERPEERHAYISRAPAWRPPAPTPHNLFGPIGRLFDRGYSGRPEARPVARPEGRTEARPAVRPEGRPQARPETRPQVRTETRPEARPAPRPEPARPESHPVPQYHAQPQRPTAFGGNESAAAARAASSRGSESRGVSRPPSGGGGGGGNRGGNQKR